MNLKLFKRSTNPIGIDFKDKFLRIAQVKRNGNSWAFPCVRSVELSPDIIENGKPMLDDRLTDTIFEIGSEYKWNKRKEKVVIGLPSQQVILRHVQMPNIPLKSMRNALQLEFHNSIHLPFEDPVFDFVITDDMRNSLMTGNEEENNQTSVIVVAAPKDIVQKYVEVVREADLTPVAVDLTLCGLDRFSQIYFSDEMKQDKNYMLVHVLWDSIEVGIFSNRTLFFSRYINISFNNYIYNERQASFSTSSVQAFASDLSFEIERALNFFEYTFSESIGTCNRVFIISELPETDQIVQVIRERIDQPVLSLAESIANYYDMSKTEASEFSSVLSSLAVSIGLSMKEVHKTWK